MEFTCLHCRERLTVDDEQSGERVACPNCDGMVTVPKPIGGRLTERRIAASPPPPLVIPTQKSPTQKKPLRAISEDEVIPKAVGPKEPDVGFRFETRLPKIQGNDERAEMEQCLNDAIERLQSHLEQHPQFFRSGGFVLELDHLTVMPGGHDARLRLFGSLNHEPFNASASITAGRAKHRVPVPVWSMVFVESIDSAILRQSPLRRRCRSIRNSAVRQFCYALDDTAERHVGLLSKIWRSLVELS